MMDKRGCYDCGAPLPPVERHIFKGLHRLCGQCAWALHDKYVTPCEEDDRVRDHEAKRPLPPDRPVPPAPSDTQMRLF